ncbi:LemA family protein [Chitinimonas sp.]|uniref:LemA family protein n=1 Tax=Chitinimonas sp. TaxID=1934313 RepID=UPI002F9427A5
MPLLILLAILVLALVYLVMLYNQLVALKHNVVKSWSNIDVLLKQRHEELPKLVETCKQYAQFEQATLTRVMEARAAVASARELHDLGQLGQAETRLRASLGNLIATVEAYPELKTNEHYQHLIQRITGLEDAIADRREFYNEAVNINNVRIEQFPDVLLAKVFTFPSAQPLQFASEEKRDVDMKALFH